MNFLDLNGLTHFWNKIKTFISDNCLSLNGGKIKGIVNVLNKNDTTEYISIDSSSINNSKYPPHYLFANGKMVPIGEANGVASLDSEGNIPLRQLRNLDTTVAEVVTALPKTNIKKHIYLIKVSSVTQNQYEEYLYTGDTSAEYDDSKWEKLGDFRPTVDFANYAKKTDTVKNISFSTYGSTNTKILKIVKADDTIDNVSIPTTSINGYGFMDESDKRKLDGIANNANNYSLPTASSTTKGGITLGYPQSGKNYPVVLDGNGKAYVNVPWTDTNTTYGLATSTNNGIMSGADKKKLDGIEINANDYSLPLAAANTRGGIKVGYQANSGFPVKLDSEERAYVTIPIATQDESGLFYYRDQKKLDRLDLSNISDDAIVYMDSILKNVRIDKDTSSVSLTLVAVSDDETEVTIQAATSSLSGVMSASDKAKLDGIASGATADSAITTAEIDALFA